MPVLPLDHGLLGNIYHLMFIVFPEPNTEFDTLVTRDC